MSPDGAWVGFEASESRTLKKVSILGGPVETICDCGAARGRASWGTDDTVVFAKFPEAGGGLWRVPAEGGAPELLITPDGELGQMTLGWPDVLPGGQAVLFTIIPDGPIEGAQIAVLTGDGDYRVLIPPGSHPRYVSTGHIVYAMGGTLWAVGFDLASLMVMGAPIPVVQDVIMYPDGAGLFAVAQNGSLVYGTEDGSEADGDGGGLVWVDRQGRQDPLVSVRVGQAPRLSPDGMQMTYFFFDQEQSGGAQIWADDMARGTGVRVSTDSRLTQWNSVPVWTPDGERVVFHTSYSGPRTTG